MPTRPDLRDIAHNVRDALGDCDREQLIDLLTFVLKEYVVEGPPPMLVHQAETIADLQGLNFAQLITAMQTRLDLPELALFAVDGQQVSVRIGGVMQPLQVTRGGPAAAELPRPAAGVRVVETPIAPMRPTPPVATEPAQAPRPAQGVSVRGRPTSGEMPSPPSAPSPAAAPSGQGAPAAAPGQSGQSVPAQPAAAQPDKKDGDDASARFSLLELD
jgi:hypothetical protein